jgi:hypothetical protein
MKNSFCSNVVEQIAVVWYREKRWAERYSNNYRFCLQGSVARSVFGKRPKCSENFPILSSTYLDTVFPCLANNSKFLKILRKRFQNLVHIKKVWIIFFPKRRNFVKSGHTAPGAFPHHAQRSFQSTPSEKSSLDNIPVFLKRRSQCYDFVLKIEKLLPILIPSAAIF